jgi:hypothetical protein
VKADPGNAGWQRNLVGGQENATGGLIERGGPSWPIERAAFPPNSARSWEPGRHDRSRRKLPLVFAERLMPALGLAGRRDAGVLNYIDLALAVVSRWRQQRVTTSRHVRRPGASVRSDRRRRRVIEFLNVRPGQTGRAEMIESVGGSGPWRTCHVKFQTTSGLEAGRVRIDINQKKPIGWESDADRARREAAAPPPPTPAEIE